MTHNENRSLRWSTGSPSASSGIMYDAGAMTERGAFDVLHRDKQPAVGLSHLVDRADVRVLERGRHPGFPLESGATIGIGGDVRGKDLQRDIAAQSRVVGQVDFAHPSGAK